MENNFWGRVLDLLAQQDISRKEFAAQIGISYSSIHNGVSLDSIPSADIALKIANRLNTSIEYLIYGNSKSQSITGINKEAFLYRKNKDFIDALDTLPGEVRNSLKDLIFRISKYQKSDKSE